MEKSIPCDTATGTTFKDRDELEPCALSAQLITETLS
jgi:hypothetical protein